jgi:tetratricopeptide (TPR) repeat protein
MMLLPFRNVTRAAANDWLVSGAPLMLGEALGQFTDLAVVPDQRLTAAMRRLGLALDASPDETQLLRLAEATDGWTAISGNVIATGSKLRISANALDVPTATVISRAETDVDANADIRPAIDRLTVQLLGAVGVHGSSNLVALTTRSVDAYRAYATGVGLVQRGAFKRGSAALTEAVHLDSSFALAWSSLSFAALQAAGLSEILNPFGVAARAAEQAARHSSGLSPRQAATVRILQAAFHADFTRSHRLADSLVATDSGDVTALMWLGMVEMLDSRLDTTTTPPSRAGSFNRSIAAMKRVLDFDPSQLLVYAFPATEYAFAAGFMDGILGARRRPVGSLAAEFLTKQDVPLEPLLRDSIDFLTDSELAQLPAGELARDRLRAADAGASWVVQWLAASPNDPEAHLWASRFEELLGRYASSLEELNRVFALGSESNVENLRARRMSLFELTGQYQWAEALADSIVQAGGLRTAPLHPGFDRSRAYVTAIFLRSKQWDKVASLARLFSAPATAVDCRVIVRQLHGPVFSVAAPELKAIADTVAAHLDEVRSLPELAACADSLARAPR